MSIEKIRIRGCIRAVLKRGANSGVMVNVGGVAAQYFVIELESADFTQLEPVAITSAASVEGKHLYSLNGNPLSNISYPAGIATPYIAGDPEEGNPDWNAPPLHNNTGALPHTATISLTGTPGRLYYIQARNVGGGLGPARLSSTAASNYLVDAAWLIRWDRHPACHES